jgi:hypothetical protein
VSLTQAMSLGWTADDVVETLRARSRTPVPQPLEYMVRDLPRDTSTAAQPSDGRGMDGEGHRAPKRARPHDDEEDLSPGDRLDDPLIREIIRTLRDNDAEVESVDYGSYSESLGTTPLDTLREAIETQEVVWLAFVDRVGARHEQMARVTSVDDGMVGGRDVASGEPLAIAVSRIVAAHIVRATASH